jgi:uncharacterized membrane protein YgaE (UPF0421/DUF939 family)
MTIGRDGIRTAVQIALVALAAYVCGFRFTSFFHGASAGMGALWSVITAIAVLQLTRGRTLKAAWMQLPGIAIGSAVSAAYLAVLPFGPEGLAAAILVTVLLCHAAGLADHARMAATTVAMMMVIASLVPTLGPVIGGVLRFSEACIGTAIAVAAVWAWPGPVREAD